MPWHELVIRERSGVEQRSLFELGAVEEVVAARILRRRRPLIVAVSHDRFERQRQAPRTIGRLWALDEPRADRGLDPLRGRHQRVPHLGGRGRKEPLVCLQEGSEFRQRTGEFRLAPDGLELPFEASDFLQADRVDLLRRQRESGVLPDQEAVVAVAGGISANANIARRAFAVRAVDVCRKAIERRIHDLSDRPADRRSERVAGLGRYLSESRRGDIKAAPFGRRAEGADHRHRAVHLAGGQHDAAQHLPPQFGFNLGEKDGQLMQTVEVPLTTVGLRHRRRGKTGGERPQRGRIRCDRRLVPVELAGRSPHLAFPPQQRPRDPVLVFEIVRFDRVDAADKVRRPPCMLARRRLRQPEQPVAYERAVGISPEAGTTSSPQFLGELRHAGVFLSTDRGRRTSKRDEPDEGRQDHDARRHRSLQSHPPCFGKRVKRNCGSGVPSDSTSAATISPSAGPILKPWPEPPPTIHTLDAAG